MDTDSLVEEKLVEQKIDDGRRLLKELERDGFDVTVALWARRGEEKKWRLYIASKEVETAGRRRTIARLAVVCSHRCIGEPVSSFLQTASPTGAVFHAVATRGL